MLKLKSLPLVTASIVLTMTLAGCDTNDVQQFNPNYLGGQQLKQSLTKQIALGTFSMSNSADDKNSLTCRLAAHIALPNNTTYSQYIKQAFAIQLGSIGRYNTTGPHTLSASIQSLDFDSVEGTWTLVGNMQVDANPTVNINSLTRFRTSYDGVDACRNVTDAFQTAVQDFISKTLENPTLQKELNQ